MLGELSIDAALRELERILANPAPAPLPVSGVHLLGRIEQVGPGYKCRVGDGIHGRSLAGSAHRQSTLLPPRTAAGSRHASRNATGRADRSARSLERLAHRTPELIVSWPARVYDYETEPSPAVRDWPPATDEIAPPAASTARSTRLRTTVADAAPEFRPTALPGGAGMLNRQARNPLLAFLPRQAPST